VIFQVIDESLRELCVPVVGASDGAGHGGHSVGIVASIHPGEQALLEVLRGSQGAPEGTREGFQDVGPVAPVGMESRSVTADCSGESR
jgi:hypothetical protein